MAIVYSSVEAFPSQPPSPSLTNPDMILPFDQESRESTPTPTFGASSKKNSDTTQPDSKRSSAGGMVPSFGMPGDWHLTNGTADDLRSESEYDPGQAKGQQQDPKYLGNGAPTTGRDDGISPVPSNGSGERDPFSQLAFLKAEEILANAKKRLTTMESNLTRARSLSITRSASAASGTVDGSPSQRFPIGPSRGPSWAISAAKLRQTGFTGSAGSGHNRVFSDTSVPIKQNFGTKKFEGDRVRSSSAMGMKDIERDSHAEHGSRNGRYLEPLQEDDLLPPQPEPTESVTASQTSDSRPSSQSPAGSSRVKSSIQLRDLREQMADLKGKVHSLKERTREDSKNRRSMQMAKSPNPFTDADAYSRAETGGDSPTEQENGHLEVPKAANDKASTDGRSTVIDDVSQEVSPVPTPAPTQATEQPRETFLDIDDVQEEEAAESIDELKQQDIDGSDNDDEEDMEVDEILPEYNNKKKFDPLSPHSQQAEFLDVDDLDEKEVLSEKKDGSESVSTGPRNDSTDNSAPSSSPQTSVSEVEAEEEEEEVEGEEDTQVPQIISHEDRPDAFDYENFVLNSAMGSFSRQGVRSSSSSSSLSTIGPGQQDGYDQRSFLDAHSQLSLNSSNSPPRAASSRRTQRSRRGSDESVSSVGTFATAVSGDGYVGAGGPTYSANGNAAATTNGGARSASRSASRTASRSGSRAASSRPSHSQTPSYFSSSNYSQVRPPSTIYHGGGKTSSQQYNRSSFSPTNEATSIQARSQILSALLADPMGNSPRATPETMLMVKPEDEALIRAVIEGMQRACGRLVRGDDSGAVVRARLEAARKALGGGEDGIYPEGSISGLAALGRLSRNGNGIGIGIGNVNGAGI